MISGRGGGFTRAELEAAAGTTVSDLLPEPLKLLFVGINPGLWTAAAQAHFAKRGNRFYPALHVAGITDWPFDESRGYQQADLDHLFDKGVGITNIVPRASARADELGRQELQEGGERLRALVATRRPRVVAVLGLTAYRLAFNQPKAMAGEQAELFQGARLFVLPNPSGLNAHETVASLAVAYGAAAQAAGVDLSTGDAR